MTGKGGFSSAIIPAMSNPRDLDTAAGLSMESGVHANDKKSDWQSMRLT